MFKLSIYWTALLLLAAILTTAGCQTAGNSRSTYDTPPSSGHCPSCG